MNNNNQHNKDCKTVIYKNDLKYLSKINIDDRTIESDVYESTSYNNKSEPTVYENNEIIFDSDVTENLYNKYKDKNKIDLRIKCSKDENYNYLDLSSLHIKDKQLTQLLNIKLIRDILNKIEYLDVSNNELCIFPDLSKFKNIKVLNISNNNITGEIIINNYEEISCRNNNITCLKSFSLKKLDANDNKITSIDVPCIEIMYINDNKLKNIDNYKNLKYLECMSNNIEKIGNMDNLEELFISNNNLTDMNNLHKLEILNCVDNPIKKINFFPKLKIMMVSTKNICKEFNIISATKIKNDFFVKLIK